MNNNNLICIPIDPNQRVHRTIIVESSLYVLTSYNDEKACYQPIGATRKRRRKMKIVCEPICVQGLSSSNAQTPCGAPNVLRALKEGGELQLYFNQLVASLGTSPYTFIIISGLLPLGLALSASGLISGTPPAFSAANNVFTVEATDSNGCKGTQIH